MVLAALRVLLGLAARTGRANATNTRAAAPCKVLLGNAAGVPLRDVQIAARYADPRDDDPVRPGPEQPGPAASYIVTAFIAGAS